MQSIPVAGQRCGCCFSHGTHAGDHHTAPSTWKDLTSPYLHQNTHLHRNKHTHSESHNQTDTDTVILIFNLFLSVHQPVAESAIVSGLITLSPQATVSIPSVWLLTHAQSLCGVCVCVGYPKHYGRGSGRVGGLLDGVEMQQELLQWASEGVADRVEE